MKRKHSNFVLSIIQKLKRSRKRTDEGGVFIRYTRLRKFKKPSKKISIAAQIVAIWYLSIFAISYLSTDTGAYFNDVEVIEGSIAVSSDYCADAKNGSKLWRTYCKDNAGIGNGPDKPDEGTGKHTDPDNPGHNKDDCDDHTSAPCSEGKSNETEESETEAPADSVDTVVEPEEPEEPPSKDDEVQVDPEESVEDEQPQIEIDEPLGEISGLGWSGSDKGNSGWMVINWKNPDSPNFSHVTVYKDGETKATKSNITNQQVELKGEDAGAIYKIVTVDSKGNESQGIKVKITKDKVIPIN